MLCTFSTTAFDGIDGVYIVADDIIIAAPNVEEHDMIHQQILARVQDCNVKLNFDKLQLLSRILGHHC